MKEKIIRWLCKAGRRAVGAMTQSAIAVIGTTTMMSAVDWKMVASVTGLSGIISILTSIGNAAKSKKRGGKTENVDDKAETD